MEKEKKIEVTEQQFREYLFDCLKNFKDIDEETQEEFADTLYWDYQNKAEMGEFIFNGKKIIIDEDTDPDFKEIMNREFGEQ